MVAILRAAVLNQHSGYVILHLANPLPTVYVTTMRVGLGLGFGLESLNLTLTLACGSGRMHGQPVVLILALFNSPFISLL